ncbi:MAG: class E sortase [Nocardioides sp.]|uniref:class E sortase n=1 Tax=Nocardioides sp. TaxID=35761 RepID=UPI0039E5A219
MGERRRGADASSAPRRGVFYAGIVLVLAGLCLLGYVGWQFWGTNWVSHRHQAEARKELHAAWRGGHRAATTDFGTTQALIEIPRFGADYEVPVFTGTSEEVLAAGFGHFTGTAGPGQVGNYALAAHRVTHGEPLRQMPDLRVGDVIRVVTRDTTYVYTLTTGGDDLVVPFTAGWVIDPLPHNPDGGVEPAQRQGQRLITLTTCSELFHTDNRMIAFGVLTATHPRSTGTRSR